MGIALGLVGRNPYLTKAQKLVQARVYAQGLTLAVLVATAAFEVGDANKGRGRWETVKILDPNDPEHKHLIEKRIHHEAYEGEDLWRGTFSHSVSFGGDCANYVQIWLLLRSERLKAERRLSGNKKLLIRQIICMAMSKPRGKRTRTESSASQNQLARSTTRRPKQ